MDMLGFGVLMMQNGLAWLLIRLTNTDPLTPPHPWYLIKCSDGGGPVSCKITYGHDHPPAHLQQATTDTSPVTLCSRRVLTWK
jgi:hypothetical protein